MRCWRPHAVSALPAAAGVPGVLSPGLPVGQMMLLSHHAAGSGGALPDARAASYDLFGESVLPIRSPVPHAARQPSPRPAQPRDGFPVAILMRNLNSRWQSLLVLIMVSPLLTSVVVRTLAWVVLLSRAASSTRASARSGCRRCG